MRQFAVAITFFCLATGALTQAADQKTIEALTGAGAKVSKVASGGSRVDIPAEKLSDDVWKQIESLGDLKFFSVKGNAFDNTAIARLSKIATVENIVIYNPGFDDQGMTALASLPNFKTLNIDHGLTINGSGLAAMQGKKLEMFNIGGSKVDDAGMAGIGKVSQLRDLSIRHVRITGTGFANFGKLPGLKKMLYFDSFRPQVAPADLANLSGLKELEDLTLGEMVLPYEGGLSYLKPLAQLKKLMLKDCGISEADLAKLKADLPSAKITFTPAKPEDVKRWNDQLEKMKNPAPAK